MIRKPFAPINTMKQYECNNQSFSRILFYYAKNLYIYIYMLYNKLTLHYLEKREEKAVKQRVTPKFCEY
jgi:hypothetical protein